MPFMSGRMASAATAPVDMWAVGTRTYDDLFLDQTRPCVLYKPAGGSWGIKYTGAEIPRNQWKATFTCGCRNPDEPLGTIVVSCNSRKADNTSLCWAARSTDFGATWSYIAIAVGSPLGPLLPTIESVLAVTSPAAGRIVVSTEWGGSVGPQIACGDSAGLVLSTYPAGGSAAPRVPDFLFLPERISPTHAPVFMTASKTVWSSSDGGATWIEVAVLPFGVGGTGGATRGTVGFDGTSALFATAEASDTAEHRVFKTTDFTSFESVLSTSGESGMAGVVGSRPGKFRLIQGATSRATGDSGATWDINSDGSQAGVTRARYLGGALYGVAANQIKKYSGGAWKSEPLPEGIPAGTIFSDVFGALYPRDRTIP